MTDKESCIQRSINEFDKLYFFNVAMEQSERYFTNESYIYDYKSFSFKPEYEKTDNIKYELNCENKDYIKTIINNGVRMIEIVRNKEKKTIEYNNIKL